MQNEMSNTYLEISSHMFLLFFLSYFKYNVG